MAFFNDFSTDIESFINDDTRFFVFRDRDIFVKNGESLSRSDFFALKDAGALKSVFYEDGYNYFGAVLAENAPAEGSSLSIEAMNLREYFSLHDKNAVLLSSRAKGITQWRHSTRFCSFCGTATEDSKTFSALYCPKCKKEIFPRIEPATITLVTRGDEILLARHENRIQHLWACLSGFIEMGETAEQCVEREIMEEVGLRVKNIKYRASQSWSFPNQLMLAFTAEYDSGEIREQAGEIAKARWFHRDALPEIPPKGSVAYNLITSYCGGKFD